MVVNGNKIACLVAVCLFVVKIYVCVAVKQPNKQRWNERTNSQQTIRPFADIILIWWQLHMFQILEGEYIKNTINIINIRKIEREYRFEHK